MGRILYLFTNEFPYGSWEPYLETEIRYYKDFDKVIIFALQLRKDHAETIRPMPRNVEVVPIWYAPRWVYLINSFTVLADASLYREIAFLLQKHRLTPGRIVDLFIYLSRSHYEVRRIRRELKARGFLPHGKGQKGSGRGSASQAGERTNAPALLYSYRFEYQPYVAMLLKKQLGLTCRIVARGHGSDMYEMVRPHGYLPLRRQLMEEVSRIYVNSNYARNYLRGEFPEYASKLEVQYLGTISHGTGPLPARRGSCHIVSCSAVVRLKRLDYIVRALASIRDRRIVWTHYGDGPLLEEVRALAGQILPENVTAEFRGNIPNKTLMEEYQEVPVDLFLNVSSSEGVPVSIMEAVSFGIPCVATDVGGTGELLETGVNGILLSPDPDSEELSGAILHILDLPEQEYGEMRKKAQELWNRKFNADTNYTAFVKEMERDWIRRKR